MENPDYQDPLPNYKIPKRKESETVSIVDSYTTPLNWGPPITNIETAGTASNQGLNYNSNSTMAPVTYDFDVYKNKRPVEKEIPKNIGTMKRTMASACPELSDSSLPKELTSQFQPLFCKLCDARLYSNANALLHYKSKGHDKKIRSFLIQYSERTGEPLHKRAKIIKQKEEDNDPKNKHCDICDLDFTSKMHAQQHYMGRNHHKAAVNKAPPPKCILGEDGNWKRIQKSTKQNDPCNRNGIGMAFAKPEELQPEKGKFHCRICDVFVTCQDNLETHYAGIKHKKTLEKLGRPKEMVINQSYKGKKNEIEYEDYYTNIFNNICETFKMDYELAYNPLAELSNSSTSDKPYDAWDPSSEPTNTEGPQIGAWEPIDTPPTSIAYPFSTNRTPSGQYYCEICNISLNSESQYKQHNVSKKHTKNKLAMAAIKSSAH